MQRSGTKSQTGQGELTFGQYRHFMARDLVLVALTITLWILNSQATLDGLPAVGLGILTGFCAMQLHEWAHIWGAMRARADIYPAARWWHPFMFSLDHTTNCREQFLQVSLPAFAATALYISAFWLALPREQLAGQTALIMGSVTASLTLLIEVPLFVRVWQGHALPPVELFARQGSESERDTTSSEATRRN